MMTCWLLLLLFTAIVSSDCTGSAVFCSLSPSPAVCAAAGCTTASTNVCDGPARGSCADIKDAVTCEGVRCFWRRDDTAAPVTAAPPTTLTRATTRSSTADTFPFFRQTTTNASSSIDAGDVVALLEVTVGPVVFCFVCLVYIALMLCRKAKAKMRMRSLQALGEADAFDPDVHWRVAPTRRSSVGEVKLSAPVVVHNVEAQHDAELLKQVLLGVLRAAEFSIGELDVAAVIDFNRQVTNTNGVEVAAKLASERAPLVAHWLNFWAQQFTTPLLPTVVVYSATGGFERVNGAIGRAAFVPRVKAAFLILSEIAKRSSTKAADLAPLVCDGFTQTAGKLQISRTVCEILIERANDISGADIDAKVNDDASNSLSDDTSKSESESKSESKSESESEHKIDDEEKPANEAEAERDSGQGTDAEGEEEEEGEEEASESDREGEQEKR